MNPGRRTPVAAAVTVIAGAAPVQGRRAILVLGMHRSGTSALARVLGLCGASLPSKTWAADQHNVTGYWEPAEIVTFHEELLQAVGSAHDDIGGLPRAWFASEDAAGYRRRLASLIEDTYGQARLWAVKDPRICRLLPLWLPVLDQMRVEPLAVIPVRNPLEVAASLGARDKLSLAKSLLLWLRHFLEAEVETRGIARSVVGYEGLLHDWQATMGKVARDLGLEWPRPLAVADAEVKGFLDPTHRHHTASLDDLELRRDVSEWVKSAYRLALQSARDGSAAHGELDELRESVAAADLTYLPLVADWQLDQARLAETRRELSRLEAEGHELRARLSGTAELEAALGRTRAELGAKEIVLTEREDLLAQRSLAIDRMRALLAEADIDRTRRQAWAEDLRSELATRQADLLDLRRQVQETTTRLEESEAEGRRLAGAVASGEEQMRLQVGEAGRLAATVAELAARVAVVDDERGALLAERDDYKARLRTVQERARELEFELQAAIEGQGALRQESQRLARDVEERDSHVNGLRRELDEEKYLRADERVRIGELVVRGHASAQRGRLAAGHHAEAERQVALLSSRVGALLASRSWSLTAPVRAVGRSLALLRALASEHGSRLAGLFRALAFLRRKERREAARAVLASGLFDREYYLRHNADVGRSDESPLYHYMTTGAAEDRAPCALFDPSWYRSRCRGAVPAGDNALLHFLAQAPGTHPDPHPCFRVQYYLAELGGGREASLDPVRRYLASGREAAVWPHPLFDGTYYMARYPEVAAAGVDPLLHFIELGAAEGRDPHPLFDSRYYLRRSPDVAESGTPAFFHYQHYGAAERRDTHPLFDVAYYLDANPDVAQAGIDPLEHFLASGAAEGRRPHPLFDTWYYLAMNPDVAASGLNPLVHYLRWGGFEGRDPNPEFRSAAYLEARPDVLAAGMNPLRHFVEWGAGEAKLEGALAAEPIETPPESLAGSIEGYQQVAASGLFDTDYYLQTYPDVAATALDPIAHYLGTGWREGRNPHPLFDTAYYSAVNPDVAGAGINPLLHFVLRGAIERRLPHPLFDTEFYLVNNPDVVATGANPLHHYLTRGGREGRDPCLDFDSSAYLEAYPEVAASGVNPLVHYVTAGAAQGKLPRQLESVVGDAESWRQDYEGLRGSIDAARWASAQATASVPPIVFEIEEDEAGAKAGRLAFEPAARPEVSVVVTANGSAARTVEALLALRQNTSGPAWEALLVAPASPAGVGSVLGDVPGLRIVRSEVASGRARSLNAAAHAARGRVLVFLDGTVQVGAGWLPAVVSGLGEDGVAVVGLKVVDGDGALREAGELVEPDGTLRRLGVAQTPGAHALSWDVDLCSGRCLAVERTRFLALGGFDEAYASARFQNADLCLRLREQGTRVVCAPGAEVVQGPGGGGETAPDAATTRDLLTSRQTLLERHHEQIGDLNDVSLVAFYLPQFHPIPENDRWWGKGFTEWRNVVRAKPNFVGHYQPRFPADLGFYDLRVDDVMEEQWSLARRYGIKAFCYYFYWFSGQRLLEKPLERLPRMAAKLPYCLAWANENWTRNWDGGDGSVLLSQGHGHREDGRLVDDLMPHFADPAYLKVRGRPLFLVYRHSLMNEPERTLDTWRECCVRAGLPNPYLATCETFGFGMNDEDPRELGFDATVEFPPHNLWCSIGRPRFPLNPEFRQVVYDYRQAAVTYAARPIPPFTRFKSVMVGFDNTPRRQNEAAIYVNSSPGALQAWLQSVIAQTRETRRGDERLVFINAWNEWAEGNYLEPDMAYGHGYLEAVRNALDASLLRGGSS